MSNLLYKNALIVLENQDITSESRRNYFLDKIKELYDKIPNPYNNLNSNIGLIVGKVQSGKTSVIITSSAFCLQNGYKTVISFLSDTNILLKQNFERIKKAFNGIENVKIFSLEDFEQLTSKDLEYLYKNEIKLFICILKHKKWIKKILDILKKSLYANDYTLIFDDEGDDISQNNLNEHKKFDYSNEGNLIEKNFSKTNEQIKLFKEIFNKYSYISVTATPQSIVMLQKTQHLCPDFVLTIEPSSEYCGLQYFHIQNHDSLIKTIEQTQNKINNENGISEDLKDSFYFFIAGCFYRKY